MDNTQGFLTSLFDFSFSFFITSKIIKVIYGLSIISAGFVALFIIVFGFGLSTGTGILALLIGAPLVFLVSVIYSRVTLEFIIVVFRMAENIAKMAEAQGKTQ